MTKTVQRINHQLKTYYGQIVGQLLMVCCLLVNTVAAAQVYPVQVNPQLIPPYSLKLSDYQTTSSEKLFVNILLTDTQDSGRQVRLKMYIEGQGLNIRTLDFVAGATPIFLDGGVNLRLSNLDLHPYFSLNNLLGITPQQYNQPLPDGRYDFCFEVYDQLSGQLLSQKSCASVFLILNDPPILNVPNRGDLVTAQNPQNIIFNWTPRHLNATGIQYEFTLKELWDTGLDPQAAFLASSPLHQETTFAPTLLYGPANIQLIEGKVYGWQVRALVSDGISETSVFRNNGFSEIYHFKYKGNCAPPQFILSEAQNSQTVEIIWQYAPHIRYEIQYRKKGYGDADWFSLYAYNNQHSIHNLEAGTTYEFRVGGECTVNGGFAFSNIYEFTTPTEEETAYYNCGMPPDIEITNRTPLQNIGPNEVFTAADFPVVIGKVMGSNGNFSGWGYITIPFLEDLRTYIDLINELSQGKLNIGKYTRIKVSFNNIGINTDYQLISGFVVTEYDPDWKSIIDLDEAIDDVAEQIKSFAEAIAQALNLDISRNTKENIKKVADAMTDAMQNEGLPENLVNSVNKVAENMVRAKEKYEQAKASGDAEVMKAAENEFKEAQKELENAEKEKEKFVKAYANIIRDALKEIVRESDDKLQNGLNSYGESEISEQQVDQYDITATDLGQLDNILEAQETSENDQVLTERFEYERWNTLNLIAQNLQTDEGTEQLGTLLEGEGKKLGFYIYERLEEGAKKKELVQKVKEMLIESITEKIAWSTKLF